MGASDLVSMGVKRRSLALLLVFLFAAVLVLLPLACQAALSLVWGSEDYNDEGEVISDDRIYMQASGTYGVPLAVEKSVYVEVPLEFAAFGGYGELYKAGSGDERTHLTRIGFGGVDMWSWEVPGFYEVDIFDIGEPILTKVDIWTRIARWFGGETAHADVGDFIATIRFEIKEEGADPELSSVAFFPGVQSSSLYRDGFLSEDQVWVPNALAGADDDLRHLFMNVDGTSVEDGIYTKEDDIILSAYDKVPVYEGFPEAMNKLVADGVIAEWKPIAYDWRLDLPDILQSGVEDNGNISYLQETNTPYILAELRRLADFSSNGKVSIIAHSNGGLLAKELMVMLEETNDPLLEKIDLLVLVAVPQLGTPKTLLPMLHGAENPLSNPYVRLDDKTWRGAARLSPGAYNLLPSKAYFNNSSASSLGPVVTFSSAMDALLDTIRKRDIERYQGALLPMVVDYRNRYGADIASNSELMDFLKAAEGRRDPIYEDVIHPANLSSSLLARSQALHERIDSWMPKDADNDGTPDIHVVQIAGTGIGTIRGIEYGVKKHIPACAKLNINTCGDLYGIQAMPISTTAGDETVVLASATAMPVETYYFDIQKYNDNKDTTGESFDRKHANIMAAKPVLNIVEKLLQDESLDNISYISNSAPVAGDMTVIEMHSPVDVHVYDTDGNHVGSTIDSGGVSYVETGIPNSTFLEVGESTFITLDPSEIYEVRLDGKGTGTFTFKIKSYVDEALVETTAYSDVPVTPALTGSVNIDGTEVAPLTLDTNGDGQTDKTVHPDVDIQTPLGLLREFRTAVSAMSMPASLKKTLTLLSSHITQKITKKKKGLAHVSIKSIQALIRHTRNKGILKEDADLLLSILAKLEVLLRK